MTLRASTRPAEPGAATEPGSASRSGMRRGRSRAAHSPLPLPVLALGVLGACAGSPSGTRSWAATGSRGYSEGGCHDWFEGPSVSLVMATLWHVARTFSSDLRRRWAGPGGAAPLWKT